MDASIDIASLVCKAFVLEAITDKPGCTTRYSDLPGKPLEDFVIAGINSSGVFSDFAEHYLRSKDGEVFNFNVKALECSNVHKSSKFVNFGLLEIMFPVVAARLREKDSTKVVDEIISVIKETDNRDVRNLLATRKIAWSTSIREHKINFDFDKYEDVASVWDFYEQMSVDFGVGNSNYHWAMEYKNGLPILSAFFDGYMKSGNVMESTKAIFEEQRKRSPDVSIGIVADMCAAAIFLRLSFDEGSV